MSRSELRQADFDAQRGYARRESHHAARRPRATRFAGGRRADGRRGDAVCSMRLDGVALRRGRAGRTGRRDHLWARTPRRSHGRGACPTCRRPASPARRRCFVCAGRARAHGLVRVEPLTDWLESVRRPASPRLPSSRPLADGSGAAPGHGRYVSSSPHPWRLFTPARGALPPDAPAATIGGPTVPFVPSIPRRAGGGALLDARAFQAGARCRSRVQPGGRSVTAAAVSVARCHAAALHGSRSSTGGTRRGTSRGVSCKATGRGSSSRLLVHAAASCTTRRISRPRFHETSRRPSILLLTAEDDDGRARMAGDSISLSGGVSPGRIRRAAARRAGLLPCSRLAFVVGGGNGRFALVGVRNASCSGSFRTPMSTSSISSLHPLSGTRFAARVCARCCSNAAVVWSAAANHSSAGADLPRTENLDRGRGPQAAAGWVRRARPAHDRG